MWEEPRLEKSVNGTRLKKDLVGRADDLEFGPRVMRSWYDQTCIF